MPFPANTSDIAMSPEAYTELAAIESGHWWYVSRRAIMRSTLQQLALPANARILDVGSGTGGYLDMLAEFGVVTAIEMDANARKLAAEKTLGRYEIRAGVCPSDMPFEHEKFDLICLFDVLEHIDQPVETLQRLNSLLAPGGRILLAMPAYQWLWSAHDQYLHHKRRYTSKLLAQEAALAGLQVTRATYFNMFLFPLAVTARLLDRLRKRETSSGMSTPPAFWNACLQRIFSSERALLARANLPFGLSMLAVLGSGV